MKRFWFVLVEMYSSGGVSAAVLKNKLAARRPPEFYKREPGRELFGEWFDSEKEAQAVAAEAKSLNASLAGKPRAA
jgi:hypothetical protein